MRHKFVITKRTDCLFLCKDVDKNANSHYLMQKRFFLDCDSVSEQVPALKVPLFLSILVLKAITHHNTAQDSSKNNAFFIKLVNSISETPFNFTSESILQKFKDLDASSQFHTEYMDRVFKQLIPESSVFNVDKDIARCGLINNTEKKC